MRNLTTSVVTTSTGKFIQLVDPTTGELHQHIAADAVGPKILWNDVTVAPAATGNTGTLPRFERMPDGTSYFVDAAGVAHKTGDIANLVFDNQVLSGDDSGNTTITLTPTTVTDESGGTQVNYLIKVVTKIDGTTITEDPTTHVLSAKQPVITNTQTGAHTIATITDASGTVTNIQESITGYIDATDAANHHKIGDHIDENGNTTEVFETVIGVTNTLASGVKIATITNEDGVDVDVYAPANFDALTTVQPTPTATGNTTNLNTVFKDANGDTWIVDSNGDAIKAGSASTGSTSALWVDVTTNPAATGNTGTLPRFENNTVTGDKWYIDSTGKAVKIESGTSTCGTVFFNGTDPSTATIFDTANPPVTNDNALKNLDCAVYIGTDGSFWSSNGSAYATKTYSAPTHRYTQVLATAGQTTYTLPSVPVGSSTLASNRGIVHVTRNGVTISGAWSWVGAVGTYDNSKNYGCLIDSSDKLEFHWEAY